MRYTSIIHCGDGHNIQSDFSGPQAREDFQRRCENIGANWGRLFAEKTGKEVFFYQADQSEVVKEAPDAPSATARRLAQSTPVKATTIMADLATLVGQHGDQVVLFAIPDEGAFNVERPRHDTDGQDSCFVM